jgi:tetratricopeptide (TPR) repeat protein
MKIFRVNQIARVLLLIGALCSGSTSIQAADALHQDILAAQEALYRGDFDQALDQFSAITQTYPDDPKGYFFLALTYRWLTRTDPGSSDYQELFERAAARSITESYALMEEDKKNAEAILYLAASYGYRSEYYNFLKQSWNRAYNDGVKMREYLEKAEKFPDQPIDVQLGYGLYNYYAYLYREKIGWWRFLLSLPKGDKEKGLRLLEQVREEGLYARIEAWYFLIEIYKDEKERETQARALTLSEELHQKYPQNPFFHTLLAGIYHKQHKWQRSIETARDIVAQAPGHPYYSDYLVYQARYLIGESLFFLGQYEQSLREFDEIIASQPGQPRYLLPWAHLRRGTIYSLTGQPEQAAAEYQLVLEMDNVHNIHDLAEGLLERQQKNLP